jgi:hypothetical protein
MPKSYTMTDKATSKASTRQFADQHDYLHQVQFWFGDILILLLIAIPKKMRHLNGTMSARVAHFFV